MPNSPLIRAVNWNVNHSSDADDVRPMIKKIIKNRRPNYWALQEVQGDDGIAELLRDEFGLAVRRVEPEFLIAVDPTRFKFLHTHAAIMSEHDYWKERNLAQVSLLWDNEVETKLRGMSYHPPAHVQVPKHVTFDNVMQVHRDFAKKHRQIALRGKDVPFISSGDSNIDPKRGWKPKDGWDWWFGDPLRYVPPVSATHGKARMIDQFMVHLLIPEGRGAVYDEPRVRVQDHRPVMQNFRYAPKVLAA